MSAPDLPVAPATRRTGLPETRLYRRGEPRQPWAVRALADAAALYGPPDGPLPVDLCGEADIGPSYEWRRELAAEREELAAAGADPPAPVIVLPALPAAVPQVPVPAAPRQPEPPRAEPAPPDRCPRCKYLTSAIGHKLTCGAPC